MDVNLTRMSAKGQLVIPSQVRRKLGLTEGTPFAVATKGDVILLRKIKMPTIEDFDRLVAKAGRSAAAHGIRQDDMDGIIHKHRGDKA